MRRLAVGAVVAAVGVGAGIGIGAVAHVGTRTRTVARTTTRFKVVNGSRSAGAKPAPLPTDVEGATDPRAVVLSSAIPADANLDNAAFVDQMPRQLVVSWDRADLASDGAAHWERRGFAIWQLNRKNVAIWRRVYTYERVITNRFEIDDVKFSTGDISGDGRPELLVFLDTGGSAGTGIYRLFVSSGERVRQPLVRSLSQDEGTISFGGGALVVREGVGPFRGPGIHCCFRRVRITRLRWDGHRLVVVRRVVRKNLRGWPPG